MKSYSSIIGFKGPISLKGQPAHTPATHALGPPTVRPRRRALAAVYGIALGQLALLMCGGTFRGSALLGMAGTAVVQFLKRKRGGGSRADLAGRETELARNQTHTLKSIPVRGPTASPNNVQSPQAVATPAEERT